MTIRQAHRRTRVGADASSGIWAATFLMLLLAAPAFAQDKPQDLHDDCPDITGVWSSGTYDALTVLSTGASSELRGLSMTLEIGVQHGCHFTGTNGWTNGAIGGSEAVAGILNPIGNWISIIEMGPHPEIGTSGRVFGRLIDDKHINWEYAAYSSDRTRATVFSTVLSRGGAAPVRERCPDLTGTWLSEPYDILEVGADGPGRVRTGPKGTLTVERQYACHIDGQVAWTGSETTEHERVVGVLHADGRLITILSVGEHSEAGTRAYIHAEVAGRDLLHWDFVGLNDDESFGQAFTTLFVRDGARPVRQSCPNLVGTWSSSHWEGLESDAGGSVERVTRDYKSLIIKEQIGCTLWGELTFGPREGIREAHTDLIIGTVDGEDGLVIIRNVGPHPGDGYSAIAQGRLQSPDHMIIEYTGQLARKDGAFVYLLDLQRE